MLRIPRRMASSLGLRLCAAMRILRNAQIPWTIRSAASNAQSSRRRACAAPPAPRGSALSRRGVTPRSKTCHGAASDSRLVATTRISVAASSAGQASMLRMAAIQPPFQTPRGPAQRAAPRKEDVMTSDLSNLHPVWMRHCGLRLKPEAKHMAPAGMIVAGCSPAANCWYPTASRSSATVTIGRPPMPDRQICMSAHATKPSRNWRCAGQRTDFENRANLPGFWRRGSHSICHALFGGPFLAIDPCEGVRTR